MYAPNVPSTSVPFAEDPPLDTLSTLVPCAPALYAENSVMWAPVAQLQLWLALPPSLPGWVTSEDFELVSQDYEGGNVTVEEAPASFSPFSPVDCMLFSHFSFNDFVALGFLDLALDPDMGI